MSLLKYYTMDTCITEIPDEICLGISVIGCPIHCNDCHSKHTWKEDENSKLLTYSTIKEQLINSNDYYTCVLFFGGEWQPNSLSYLLYMLQKDYGIKTALYTGRSLDYMYKLHYKYHILDILNFLKVGEYNKQLGGLDNYTTNQKLYKLEKTIVPVDITNKFWRNKMLEYNIVRTWVIESIRDIMFDNNISITDNSLLSENLKLDSLDIIDVIVSVEVKYNQERIDNNKECVDIADNEVAATKVNKINTVKDLIDFIYEEVQKHE